MKKLLSVTAFLALFLLPDAASAQDQWEAQVRMQLDSAAVLFSAAGYQATHERTMGGLAAGATETIELELEGGVEYMLMGVCDTDCTDLDLVLRDAAGSVVDSDLELDDVPLVTVTPQRTGMYTLEVRMIECSAEPCRFGVGVFGQ
jgi:hypothetical protein